MGNLLPLALTQPNSEDPRFEEYRMAQIVQAIRQLQLRVDSENSSEAVSGAALGDEALTNQVLINPTVNSYSTTINNGVLNVNANTAGTVRVSVSGDITVGSPLNMGNGGTMTIALVETGGADRTITIANFYAAESSFTLSANKHAIVTYIQVDGNIYGTYLTDLSLQ